MSTRPGKFTLVHCRCRCIMEESLASFFYSSLLLVGYSLLAPLIIARITLCVATIAEADSADLDASERATSSGLKDDDTKSQELPKY